MGPKIPMLIDQGSADKWLKEHLLVDNFINAANKVKYPVEYKFRD
jgi:hypothetical protein